MLVYPQVCDQNSELSEKLRQAQQAVGQDSSAQVSTLQQDLVAARVHNDSLARRMELQVGCSHMHGCSMMPWPIEHIHWLLTPPPVDYLCCSACLCAIATLMVQSGSSSECRCGCLAGS